MPIKGQGFELHIVRKQVQHRVTGGEQRERTIGTYQAYIDGKPQAGLAGFMAEQKGPSDSSPNGNLFDRRIAPGYFPLWTQYGTKYRTVGYVQGDVGFGTKPRPGIELRNTGTRDEILIHPAIGFLSSEGCIHPTSALANGTADIMHADSRARVVALIGAMEAFAGAQWPDKDGYKIPGCFCAIDDAI